MRFTKPLVLLFFFLLISSVHSRYRLPPPSDLVVDAAAGRCEQSYGFLPCTTTWLGNLFFILVYGHLMFFAAKKVSKGSEDLLEIIGPGITGGSLLPLLCNFPASILILVSGLAGSKATAQRQLSVGMGLLAGSNIMLLTVIWGTCILVGRCDIRQSDSLAINGKNEKGFHLTGTGVSTDIWTYYAARIMVISVLPFLVVQSTQFLNSTSGRHLAVLNALIVSLAMLISYCLYLISQPKVQQRRFEYAKLKYLMSGILTRLAQQVFSNWFLTDNVEPTQRIVNKVFSEYDRDRDGHLSTFEFKAMLRDTRVSYRLRHGNRNELIAGIMGDFDLDGDGRISMDEFSAGISKWLGEAQRASEVSTVPKSSFERMKFFNHFRKHAMREYTLLGAEDSEDQSNRVVESKENGRKETIKTVILLSLGAIIAAVFADPLVDSLDNFSDATGIPAFFTSFIALPVATNSGQFVSAIASASRKKLKTASLTFSELYGAVTINSVLCLPIFLAIVYVRKLRWEFSSEVFVIFIVCNVVGLLASFRNTFPLWTAALAYLLYPFSLAMVYVLNYRFGWA